MDDLGNTLQSEIFKAAEAGEVGRVRELIQDTGPAIRHPHTHSTLLHTAAAKGQVDMVLLLLAFISPNTVNNEGRTPAHLAAKAGHTQVLRLFVADTQLDHHSRDNTGATYTHLLSEHLAAAVVVGDRGRVQELLRLGADPDRPTSPSPTAPPVTPRHLAHTLAHNALIPLFREEAPSENKEERKAAASQGVPLHTVVEGWTSVKSGLAAVKTWEGASAIPLGPDVYPVNSHPRGYVCILDYNTFKDRPHLQLRGGQHGSRNLAAVFDKMGYSGHVFTNLTACDTTQELLSIKTMDRLREVDCAIFYVSSHGVAEGKQFLTSDRKLLRKEWITSMFQDSHCFPLKNKPKLFIFDLCYGYYTEKEGHGTNSGGESILNNNSTDRRLGCRVTEHQRDTVLLHSSCGGFTWYSFNEGGSTFTRALCSVLAHHAHHYELQDLYRELVKECTKTDPAASPQLHNIVFTKKFFFNPTANK